jgi:FkbM family methyltransferase
MHDTKFALRPGTWDELIVGAVFGGKTVVDVGAHIGAFSVFAAQRGARRVLAHEPAEENFRLLVINAAGYPAIEPQRAAVWRSDRVEPALRLRPSANASNTGGGSVIECDSIGGHAPGDAEGHEVGTIAFDDIVERVGTVGLLKIDAEGSEYPILATSRRLDRVEAIVGEYHRVDGPDASMCVPGLAEWDGDALMDLLDDRGFDVAVRVVDGLSGLFRATRR